MFQVPALHHFCFIRGTSIYPDDTAAARGKFATNVMPAIQRALKSTDAIGQSTLTISNLLIGSEVRLFMTDGTEIAGGTESCSSSTLVFTYSVYNTPTQVYLVVMLPGYHPLRIPFQLNQNAISYTAYQVSDPNYLP